MLVRSYLWFSFFGPSANGLNREPVGILSNLQSNTHTVVHIICLWTLSVCVWLDQHSDGRQHLIRSFWSLVADNSRPSFLPHAQFFCIDLAQSFAAVCVKFACQDIDWISLLSSFFFILLFLLLLFISYDHLNFKSIYCASSHLFLSVKLVSCVRGGWIDNPGHLWGSKIIPAQRQQQTKTPAIGMMAASKSPTAATETTPA